MPEITLPKTQKTKNTSDNSPAQVQAVKNIADISTPNATPTQVSNSVPNTAPASAPVPTPPVTNPAAKPNPMDTSFGDPWSDPWGSWGGDSTDTGSTNQFAPAQQPAVKKLTPQERVKMIEEVYQGTLDRKPDTRDINYYKYSTLGEEEIRKQLIEGKEHKQLMEDGREYKNMKNRAEQSETRVKMLEGQIKDQVEEFKQLTNLLNEKNRYIQQLRSTQGNVFQNRPVQNTNSYSQPNSILSDNALQNQKEVVEEVPNIEVNEVEVIPPSKQLMPDINPMNPTHIIEPEYTAESPPIAQHTVAENPVMQQDVANTTQNSMETTDPVGVQHIHVDPVGSVNTGTTPVFTNAVPAPIDDDSEPSNSSEGFFDRIKSVIST